LVAHFRIWERAAGEEDRKFSNKSWPPTRALWRPLLEGSPQLNELIEEPLDLELEVSVVSGGVVKLVVFLPLVGVGELQTATLSLVADRVWEGANAREVKAVHRRVAGASIPGEEKPRPFLLLAGVEELETGCKRLDHS
jgi:hypothetical protein